VDNQKLLQIEESKLPAHIAIIMDGNGRWAKSKGKLRVFGHEAGVKTVRKITEAAVKIGIKHLTLYTFSTENWNRPSLEIKALMRLLVESIKKETNTLMEQSISLKTIGDISTLPPKVASQLKETIALTANNSKMELILALSYSAKWDITNAVKKISMAIESNQLTPNLINESTISQHLQTAPFPDPDLMIRTSGEQRISNFMLWELAYSEFYFTNIHWPAFTEDDFLDAIIDYQSRKRRFGKTDEQLKINTNDFEKI